MGKITPKMIAATRSDDDLIALLCSELQERLPEAERANDEFVAKIRRLPRGLRAMADTYDLDVSLTLDSLGWHFGNWHHIELGNETTAGLDELGAHELAEAFRKALLIAQDYWNELGEDNWIEWYSGSPFHNEVSPLDRIAWDIHEAKPMGLFTYWIEYARKFPEHLQG